MVKQATLVRIGLVGVLALLATLGAPPDNRSVVVTPKATNPCRAVRVPSVQELVIETGLPNWYQTVSQLGASYHTWGDVVPEPEHATRWLFKYDGRYTDTLENMQLLAQKYPGGIWILGEEPNFLGPGGQPHVEEYVVWYHDYAEAILAGDHSASLIWGYLAQPWEGVTEDPIQYTRLFLEAWAAHTDWCAIPPLDVIHVNFFPELATVLEGRPMREALDISRIARYLDRWESYLATEPRLEGVTLSLGTGFACAYEDTGQAEHPAQAEIIQWARDLVALIRLRPRVSFLMNFPGYYTLGHGCPKGTPWASSVERGGELTGYGLALGQAWRGHKVLYLPLLSIE